MSRIPTPPSIEAAPEASKELLDAVEKQLGSVPNMFRIIANSPNTLEGYLSLNGALAKGKLSGQTRERIALAVAEVNGCNYCLAAHHYLGTNIADLTEEEITSNRNGSSLDRKAAVAIEFAVTIAKKRGKVAQDEIEKVRSAGYSNAEIVEIIGHVALNTLTNYINEVLSTEVDFPAINKLAA